MTHSLDDDWDNRAYTDPLADPKTVKQALHTVWDDPDDYEWNELDELDWDEEEDRDI